MSMPPDNHKPCPCDHRLQGTGGVFFQSTGWIYCAVCKGWQRIRKPVD